MVVPNNKTLLVDCDTGIDDAIALLYLLADPDVEICAITTVFGNISAMAAARNTLWALDVAGRTGEVPVAIGSEVTLLGEETHRGGDVHGGEGLGGTEVGQPAGSPVDERAAELIVSTARRTPRPGAPARHRAPDERSRRPAPGTRTAAITDWRDSHGRGSPGARQHNARRRGEHLA